MKLFFVDLETTGTDRDKHGIHQISGAIVIDGKLVREFDFKVAPGPSALIDSRALQVCGVTFDQINSYPPMQEVFAEVEAMILEHINLDDPNDKFFLLLDIIVRSLMVDTLLNGFKLMVNLNYLNKYFG